MFHRNIPALSRSGQQIGRPEFMLALNGSVCTYYMLLRIFPVSSLRVSFGEKIFATGLPLQSATRGFLLVRPEKLRSYTPHRNSTRSSTSSHLDFKPPATPFSFSSFSYSSSFSLKERNHKTTTPTLFNHITLTLLSLIESIIHLDLDQTWYVI